LKTSRENRFSKTKSEWFFSQPPLGFDSTQQTFSTAALTSLRISSTALAPPSRVSIVLRNRNIGWHLRILRSHSTLSVLQTRRSRRRTVTGISGAGSHGITHRGFGPIGRASVDGGLFTDLTDGLSPHTSHHIAPSAKLPQHDFIIILICYSSCRSVSLVL
jgi:hypothetical protein